MPTQTSIDINKTTGVRFFLKCVYEELSTDEKKEIYQISTTFKSMIEKHKDFQFEKFGALFAPSPDSKENKSDISPSTQITLEYNN